VSHADGTAPARFPPRTTSTEWRSSTSAATRGCDKISDIGGTEAPDETAQGEWLALVTKPGFSYLMAHVKYLRDGDYHVERIEDGAPQDGVSLTMLRVRPVRPAAAAGSR